MDSTGLETTSASTSYCTRTAHKQKQYVARGRLYSATVHGGRWRCQ